MSKKSRQYIGLISAVIIYYLIHEGAHLLYALCIGAFRQMNFMGLGIQVDVYAEKMTELQMGLFCIAGSAATFVSAYVLVFLSGRICRAASKTFKACMYYITIIMLLLDPLYLSVLCGFFGGGDMNGIALLMPEIAARIGYGVLLIVNAVIFAKVVLPRYTLAFKEEE